MNGLGTVTPQVADGAGGPSNPLSYSDESQDIVVDLDDGVDSPAAAKVTYAGLAPGFAGLYQVNFKLPASGLQNGDVYVAFNTNEALNIMATISVSGFPQSSARVGQAVHAARPQRRAGPAHSKHAKNFRRALPNRSLPEKSLQNRSGE
jgi:hypothetical protein